MPDLRHSLSGFCFIYLTLMVSWSAPAATLSTNLRITTITTQSEKHARAIELDPDNEDAYRDNDPNKMPGTYNDTVLVTIIW